MEKDKPQQALSTICHGFTSLTFPKFYHSTPALFWHNSDTKQFCVTATSFKEQDFVLLHSLWSERQLQGQGNTETHTQKVIICL